MDLSDTDPNSDADSDLPDLETSPSIAQSIRKVHCVFDNSDSDSDIKSNYVPLKQRVLNGHNTHDFSDGIEIVDCSSRFSYDPSPVDLSGESNDSCVVGMGADSPSNDSDLDVEHQPLSSLISRSYMSPRIRRDLPGQCVNSDPCVSQPHMAGDRNHTAVRLPQPSNQASTGTGQQRKRMAEDISERKRQAQIKRAEKEEQKLNRQKVRDEKQAEKEMAAQLRNAERDRKKQFGLLKDCLNFVKVILDTHLVNDLGLGVSVFKSCESIGVQCVTEPQTIPFTVTWQRKVTECNVTDGKVETWTRQVEEDNVLTLIPTSDFVQLVQSCKQVQMGQVHGITTLHQYIHSLLQQFQGKHLTAVVLGMEKYFRDQKTAVQRKHKEAVRSVDQVEPTQAKKSKKGETTTVVSRMEVEEVITDTQLQTGTMVHLVETNEEFADMIKSFTKAVAEKPAKKDRLESVFSFHEDGTTGVRVDKAGNGLLKVWKQQLLQFKNISPDIADALIAAYPSPRLLSQAFIECADETDASRLLENIVVRRGTGVLGTTRRIGKEMSRRVYTFLTSRDPDIVIK